MGNQRIINTGEVFSRLFALGLDTLEIARVFDMREGGVCDVLSQYAASPSFADLDHAFGIKSHERQPIPEQTCSQPDGSAAQ